MTQTDLTGALLKIAPSVLLLLVIGVVAKVRGFSASQDFRLVAPKAIQVAQWLVLWGLWVATSEWLSAKLGIAAPERWSQQHMLILAIRFLGMVITAPLSEELVFRGVLYSRIAKTSLGLPGAVLLPAFFFAALHVQYGLVQCAFIFLDGVVLGLARTHTKTVTVTILLHALGNLFAFVQRLPER